MNRIAIELFILAVLITANGVFAMAEIAVVFDKESELREGILVTRRVDVGDPRQSDPEAEVGEDVEGAVGQVFQENVLSRETSIDDFAASICDETNKTFTTPPAAAGPAEDEAAPAGEEITLRWRTRPDNQAEIDVYNSISEELDQQLAAFPARHLSNPDLQQPFPGRGNGRIGKVKGSNQQHGQGH